MGDNLCIPVVQPLSLTPLDPHGAKSRTNRAAHCLTKKGGSLVSKRDNGLATLFPAPSRGLKTRGISAPIESDATPGLQSLRSHYFHHWFFRVPVASRGDDPLTPTPLRTSLGIPADVETVCSTGYLGMGPCAVCRNKRLTPLGVTGSSPRLVLCTREPGGGDSSLHAVRV